MKKRIYHFLLRFWAIAVALILGLCIIASNTQASVPDAIKGIWKSENRLLYFGDGSTGAVTTTSDDFLMALALYYTWYYDAAVFSDTSQIVAKKKNAASSSFPEEFHISFKQLQNNEGFVPAYELTVTDASLGKSLARQNAIIPIAAVNDELFLDFYIKSTFGLDTFYQSVNTARDIAMNGRVDAPSLTCILTHNGAAYATRYWLAPEDAIRAMSEEGMEGLNLNEKVTFQGVKAILQEPKYFFSCGALYTSAVGRRKKARNVKLLTREEFSAMVGAQDSALVSSDSALDSASDNPLNNTLDNTLNASGNSPNNSFNSPLDGFLNSSPIVTKGPPAFKKLHDDNIASILNNIGATSAQSAATTTKEQFLAMLEALNSRRHPAPKPLFPIKEVVTE